MNNFSKRKFSVLFSKNSLSKTTLYRPSGARIIITKEVVLLLFPTLLSFFLHLEMFGAFTDKDEQK